MKRCAAFYPVLLLFLMATSACGHQDTTFGYYNTDSLATLLPDTARFADTIEGKPVQVYTLKNESGMFVSVSNYGGRIVGLIVPDKNDQPRDVVLGMDSPEAYRKSSEPYYGALIGRVGNRIAGGTFKLAGKVYHLPTNNGPNTLHGGLKGFQYRVWEGKQTSDTSLVLRYQAADGEEGFPGNLDVEVWYTLKQDQTLKIEYYATSDKPTPVNLTNHAFFNLNGAGSGTILNHAMEINASRYTPVDSTLIPLGSLEPVANTPFDFRRATAIGARIDSDSPQLRYGKGYDHNFVLDQEIPGQEIKAATIRGDKSGIVLEIFTTEPGLQFYSGNFMDGSNRLKHGATDDYRTAFALEPQHFPDAVNQAGFPSIILQPGAEYYTYSEYRFSVSK